jgi:hypothetical protein
MSGQQEPWSELDRFDQLDARDSTLDLSGLISRLNNGTQNNGSFSNGNNDRLDAPPDNGVSIGKTVIGNSGVLGNSGGARNGGVSGIGDTAPYMRPPRRAAVEPEEARQPQLPSSPQPLSPPERPSSALLPPVTPVRGAHAAVTVRPEPPGANGHGAIAAYGAYAAQGTHAAPRHSRESAETTVRAAPPAQPEITAEPVTQATRPERPAPGSLADLRQRLERLPYGHPSSPYHVDGERKPSPYRLKHLELAPPTPTRVTQAHIQPAIVEDDPIAATTPGTQVAASDGSPSQGSAVLTQDQVQIADDAYDRFRLAEGRNLFGSYGSTGLTVAVRDVAASLEYGELAPDTEQNSLIEPDAFKARFAAMLARYPDRSAELLARRIPGAISYSFIFDAERYSAGISMVQDALTATGFQLLSRRNAWNSTANRCVATMWHDPTSGLPFEVQFHTTASLEAKQLARSSASLIIDSRIPSAEAANLRPDIATAWAALPAPPGHGQIGDYRRDGGSPPPGSQQSAGPPPPGGLPPADSESG